jgi:hypothetical protein
MGGMGFRKSSSLSSAALSDCFFPDLPVNRSGLVWITGVLLRMARLIVGA